LQNTNNVALAGLAGKRKIYFVIAAVAAVALAGYFATGNLKKASGNYLTDTVKRGVVTSSVSASGTVEPVSIVSLNFENAETVRKIHVKVGDRVTAGQLLAEQDITNLEAQARQAEANLKGAETRLALLTAGTGQGTGSGAGLTSYGLARAKLERYQKLYQEGAVSLADLESVQKELINAESEIASAITQVENYRAQLQMARDDLAGAKMFSPLNGIVSAVNGAEGQRATANNNNTSSGSGFIVVISEDLQVKAQVNEADIGRTAVGQKVEFTVNSFPEKTFTGRVSSISPQAYTLSNVQIYDVIIQPETNYTQLKAGMPANVSIIVERHENTLVVPKGAVTFAVGYLNRMKQSGSLNLDGFQGGSDSGPRGGNSGPGSGAAAENQEADRGGGREQQSFVVVLDASGQPAPRRVVLGLSDLRNYEIVKGLNEGETVITGSLDQPSAAGAQGRQGGAPSAGMRVTTRR